MENGGAAPHYLDRSQAQACTFLQPSPRSQYNLSQVECEGLSPRLVTSHSRPTSTMKRDQSCPLPPPPELTITSCDSQAPLLTTFRLNSREMQELRQTLLKQRKNLRTTNSVFTVEEPVTEESLCSNRSVRSNVVRQVENLASNKENFNYLNGNHYQGDTDPGDGYTEINTNKQERASETQDVTNSSKNDISASGDNGEVIENLI